MDLLQNIKNRNIWIFGGILLIALLIRLYGIRFGLPYLFRPDEELLVYKAIQFGKTGDFNPHQFNYPSLQRYLVYIIYWIFYPVLHILKGISTSQYWVISLPNNTFFFSLTRIITAIMGTLTVWMLWKFSRDNYTDLHALLSTGLLAVVFLHVRDSHFATMDIPATFWVVCAMWSASRILKKGRIQDYILAGIFCGLAAGTKYNAGMVIIPILYSHFRYCYSNDNKTAQKQQSFYLTILILLSAFCFLISNPYILFNRNQFMQDLMFEAIHLKQGHLNIKMSIGWIYHAIFTLPYGLGWIIFLFGILGLVLAMYRRSSSDWLLLSFVIPYYIYIGNGYNIFVRYLLPIIPFMIILSVNFIEFCYLKIPIHKPILNKAFLSIIFICCFVPNLLKSLAFDHLLDKVDTRIIAANWIRKNIPENSKILVSGFYDRPALNSQDPYQVEVLGNKPVNESWFSKKNISQLCNQYKFDYLVIAYHPIIFSIPIRRSGSYEPTNCIASFSPLKNKNSAINTQDFNLPDAFYVPYKNLWNYARPGPFIRIYSVFGSSQD